MCSVYGHQHCNCRKAKDDSLFTQAYLLSELVVYKPMQTAASRGSAWLAVDLLCHVKCVVCHSVCRCIMTRG